MPFSPGPGLLTWRAALGVSIMVATACSSSVTGGESGVGGAGGAGGAQQDGGGGNGDFGGSGGAPPSPCPEPSVACCEALTAAECDIFGDACRFMMLPIYSEPGCPGTAYTKMLPYCGYVDTAVYPAEVKPATGTNSDTATGVGASSDMCRFNEAGELEAAVTDWLSCGVYGWYNCDELVGAHCAIAPCPSFPDPDL